jgi:hypothetical protein
VGFSSLVVDSEAFLDELVCFTLLGGANLDSILLISPVADLSYPVSPLRDARMQIYNFSGCRNHSALLGGAGYSLICLRSPVTKPMTHGYRRRRETQTKGTDNLFNRIIAENFLNLKKESPRCRKPTEHQADSTKKETHHNQNTQHTEQRKNSENCKREMTSHIQRQTH